MCYIVCVMRLLPCFLLSVLSPAPMTLLAHEAVSASPVAEEYGVEQQLEDLDTIYGSLLSSAELESLVKGEVPNATALLQQAVHESLQHVRPACERLRALPPARLKELCLLADAVIWQKDWVYHMYLAEHEAEATPDGEEMVGLERLAADFADFRRWLSDPQIPAAHQDALREMLRPLGGEQTMALVSEWLDERLACDYKTALQFFKDLCTAASTKDEAQSLALLKEQAEVLNYFAAKGQDECWRVNALSLAFREALMALWAEKYMPPTPYPNPVMPEELRTPARMQALQPFFDKMPALETLLLQPVTWDEAYDCGCVAEGGPPSLGDDEAEAPRGKFYADSAAGEVDLAVEVLMPESGEPRLRVNDKDISVAELASMLHHICSANVRFVLPNAAAMQSPTVQHLMQQCTQHDCERVLLALRPDNPMETDATGTPLYCVDMLCRVYRPEDATSWVEFYSDPAQGVNSSNSWQYGAFARIKTPAGKLLDYRSRMVPPDSLVVAQPWSPDGSYLLLPVDTHSGYIAVPSAQLDAADFDWAQAISVNAASEWKSAPIYSSPEWDSYCKIHFFTFLSGKVIEHQYDMETRELGSLPKPYIPHSEQDE